jgi:hypothetical protein
MNFDFRHVLLSTVIIAALSAMAIMISCGGGDDDEDDNAVAPFSLYLIDAPVTDADEINLTIDAVAVNGPDGWTDLAVTPERHNLLELMNNAGVVLAEQDLPAGDFDDAVNSTIIRDDGNFTIAALPAGPYDVVVAAAGYEIAVYVEAVDVAAGTDRTLEDPIELTPES